MIDADVQLRYCTVQQWLTLAKRQLPCALPEYQVEDSANHRIKIIPFISEFEKIVVLGGDWLPITENGVVLIDQMVHTPALYPGKAMNIRAQADGHFARFKELVEFSGEAILIGGDTNYYHWLIDFLPRLIMVKNHVDIRKYKIIVNSPLLPFQQESLRLLDVDEQQLLKIPNDVAIRAKTTLVPSLLASTTVPHPAIPKLLQSAFPRKTTPGCDYLYLSRQEARTRQLLNEPELIVLLERFGFRRYVPGSLTFQQQIDLCYGAKALVAVHGAGMANIVFCSDAANIFEIYTPQHQVTSMYMLSRLFKRKHKFVPARNITSGKDGNPLLGNWEVDLIAMESALRATFG